MPEARQGSVEVSPGGVGFIRTDARKETLEGLLPGSRKAWVECANPVHGHPLPEGYASAVYEARRRLGNGWHNRRCPECKLYGWERLGAADA